MALIRIRWFLANIIRRIKVFVLHRLGYLNINSTAIIERGVVLDKLNRKGLYIGENSLIAGGAVILTHHHHLRTKDNLPVYQDVKIGSRVFVGVNVTIMPGIEIGDECIIGAGSVVTKSIPPNSIAFGVPAMVKKSGIKMSNLSTLEI